MRKARSCSCWARRARARAPCWPWQRGERGQRGCRDLRRRARRQNTNPRLACLNRRGRPREQAAGQAGATPLALIELSRVTAAAPGAGRRWAAEPLPLTGRLTASLATRFAALPPETRAALLVAAAADSPELAAAVPGFTTAALGPAEAAGMIEMDGPGVRFAHPLVRAAVYHAVPFAERGAAHLTIAG